MPRALASGTQRDKLEGRGGSNWSFGGGLGCRGCDPGGEEKASSQVLGRKLTGRLQNETLLGNVLNPPEQVKLALPHLQ
jgi:hypothetical protein